MDLLDTCDAVMGYTDVYVGLTQCRAHAPAAVRNTMRSHAGPAAMRTAAGSVTRT